VLQQRKAEISEISELLFIREITIFQGTTIAAHSTIFEEYISDVIHQAFKAAAVSKVKF